MFTETIIFVISLSILLSFIENKSNFSSFVMIPTIVALTTKYVLGDWDEGYAWTKMDPPYWACLFGFSTLTVFAVKRMKMK